MTAHGAAERREDEEWASSPSVLTNDRGLLQNNNTKAQIWVIL